MGKMDMGIVVVVLMVVITLSAVWYAIAKSDNTRFSVETEYEPGKTKLIVNEKILIDTEAEEE